MIEKVVSYASSISLKPLHLEYSPIKGPEGNIEYLLHLQKEEEGSAAEAALLDIAAVVEAAHASLD